MSSEDGGSADGRLRRWAPGLVVLLLLILQGASFDLANQAIVTDIRFYLYFAWRISEGDVPHLDYFDHKMQLASFLGAFLLRLGTWLGTDPLLAIRVGFLSISLFGGWCWYRIGRHLHSSAGAAGLLFLAAFLSFGFLSALPAIGNLPKLVLTTALPLLGLACQRRSWLAAGFLSAVAFCDWQIGALLGFAAAGTALFERERLRALVRLGVGAVLGLLPVLLYFAWHGALAEAWDQTILASLARGSSSQAQVVWSERMTKIQALVDRNLATQGYLFYGAWIGFLLATVRLLRPAPQEERNARRRLTLPILLSSGGLLAFALFDFQGNADLFVLVSAAVPGLGFLWVEGLHLLRRFGTRADKLGPATLVILVLLLARPGPLRPEVAIHTRNIGPAVTLDDQREVAEEVARRVGGRRLAAAESCEVLFLLRRPNPLPFLFWNSAVWSHFRKGPQEGRDQTLFRYLQESGAQALIVFARTRQGTLGPAFAEHRIRSSSGAYEITLHLRR